MVSCTLCHDLLKAPVSLPCKHSFCASCISRVIQSSQPLTIHQWCPSCKAPYTIVQPNTPTTPTAVHPQDSLSHCNPLLRHSDHDHSTAELARECTRIREENLALKVHGNLWRRRAEAHASATIGLLNLTKVARDQALQIKAERDDLHRDYMDLKRKVEMSETSSCAPPILGDLVLPTLPPSPASTSSSAQTKSDHHTSDDSVPKLAKHKRTPSETSSVSLRRSSRLVSKPYTI